MRTSLLFAGLGALLAASISAQSTPSLKIFKGTFAPSANLLPLARTHSFIQTWYNGKNLPVPTVVNQLGWRMDSSANYGGVTHKLEIVLDNTPTTFGTLTKNFAGNLSAAPVTFLAMKNVNFPPISGWTDPDNPSLWIPGDAVFVFTGPNLIVQVDIQTDIINPPSTLASHYTDAYTMSASSSGNNVKTTSAPSCGGSMAVAYDGLSSLSFQLTGGPPSSTAFFLLGDDNQVFAGVPLPIDLTAFGMAGCNLAVNPLFVIGLPTDGSGNATLSGSVPVVPGFAQHFFAQAVHPAGTALGLGTTNLAGVLIGSDDNTNYVYNWTTFTGTAQYGPYTTNRGAVVLFK